jgi:hypothetical protein
VKTIYQLREDHERIALTQAASLSPRPFGLKPVNGLFASDDWWQNLDTGVIPIVKTGPEGGRRLRLKVRFPSEPIVAGVTYGLLRSVLLLGGSAQASVPVRLRKMSR